MNELVTSELSEKTISKAKVGEPGMVGHAFNPSIGRQRQADLCEFEASLVYRASSRTARATQRNPVSKKQTNKQKYLSWSGSYMPLISGRGAL